MRKAAPKFPGKEDVQLGFGVAVRALRDDMELTQEQLAERSQTHVTYISQVERGLKNVSLFNLYRIAFALSVPPSELLDAAAQGAVRRKATPAEK